MQDHLGTLAERRSPSRTLVCLLVILLLGGCASTREQDDDREQDDEEVPSVEESPELEPTVVGPRNYRDPLIGLNRAIYAFNDVSYRYALIPLSKGYINTVPGPLQQGFSNFFYNLKAPIYLVNNGLQLKPKAAGVNLLRFGINTTVGLLGFFDPATHWFDLEKRNTGFNETFAQYGAGYGIYLVIPLLGPADLRSGTSALVEGVFHPISYLADNPERIVIQSFDYFQEFAPDAERYLPLKEESEDPYIFFRNMYLQGVQRDAEYQ